MDFVSAQNTFIWSSCSILLGKVAGVHELEWHECDSLKRFRRKLKIDSNASNHDRFFAKRSNAPHSCRSSSRTPTILPKKNAELQYDHMDYGFMDRCKFIFWQRLWMDGFWVRTKKQRGARGRQEFFSRPHDVFLRSPKIHPSIICVKK